MANRLLKSVQIDLEFLILMRQHLETQTTVAEFFTVFFVFGSSDVCVGVTCDSIHKSQRRAKWFSFASQEAAKTLVASWTPVQYIKLL